jgi:hypothetical protein
LVDYFLMGYIILMDYITMFVVLLKIGLPVYILMAMQMKLSSIFVSPLGFINCRLKKMSMQILDVT